MTIQTQTLAFLPVASSLHDQVCRQALVELMSTLGLELRSKTASRQLDALCEEIARLEAQKKDYLLPLSKLLLLLFRNLEQVDARALAALANFETAIRNVQEVSLDA